MELDSYAGSAQAAWSLNRYLYAGANPTSMIDPDGHAFFEGADPNQGERIAYTSKREGDRVVRQPHPIAAPPTAKETRPIGYLAGADKENMTSSGIAISPIDVDPADQGYVPTPAENWAGNMMGPVPCFTCDAVQRMTADERKAFAGISATALLGGYGLVQLGTEVAAVSIVGVDTLYATGSASAACAAVCDRVAGLLNTAAETAGGVPPGALMGGRPIPLSELSGEQASNFARFEKALPRNVSSLGASRFENGTVQFWASVRAASPRWANASATYVKIIDETGTTIGYYKATVRQSGAATELKQKYP